MSMSAKIGDLFQKLMIERQLSISSSAQLEALSLQVPPISGDRLRWMFLELAIGDALDKTMVVSIPMSFTVRRERKLVVFSYGSGWEKPRQRFCDAMAKTWLVLSLAATA